MWVLISLVCSVPHVSTCSMYSYNKQFFDSVEECMLEGKRFMDFVAQSGKGGIVSCFDVTVIGKNTPYEPSF